MPWKLTSNHGWKFSYLHFITIYKYIFCWCVLKKQKCPSCTATGSLALDTGFFTPEQFMWLLGKEWGPWKFRVKQSQPFHFLTCSLVGGSSGPAYHTSSCPEPAELLTASLELEGKPSRAPRFYWIVVSECKWNQCLSPEIWCHFLRPPKGSTEGAS